MALSLDEIRGIFRDITAENINDPIDNLNATILHHLMRFPANTFDDVNKAISLGANINEKDINGETPLFWFANKLRRGYIKAQYDQLISSFDRTIQDKHNGTLLHVAAKNGIENICTILITKYPDLISVKNYLKKQTALHVAKNAKIAEIIINSMETKEFTLDEDGHSELFYAATSEPRRDAKLVRLIKNNFSTPPLDFHNILSAVITLQDISILPNLLLYKPKITQEIVTKAVQSNNSEILRRILELDSATDVLTEISDNVLSPYLASVTVSNWSMLYHMLKQKKCPEDWSLIVDDEGWNLAHYCLSFRRNGFAVQLIDDPQYNRLFKIKNKHGSYPLAYAVQHSTADKSNNALQKLKTWIMKGSDYQKATDTFDLLHFAIELQKIEAIEILVAMGFPFQKNGHGQSVFHKVCWVYRVPEVLDLLANRSNDQIDDVDGTDDDPDNERLKPLHYALLKMENHLLTCLVNKWKVNVDFDTVMIILQYLYKYKIDSDDVIELAELVGFEDINKVLRGEVSSDALQPIQDIVKRLDKIGAFAQPPRKDFPTDAITVQHYKLYNIIIICNNTITDEEEPLITIDIQYVTKSESVEENSYMIKFHIVPIDSFDLEDAERFADLPNKGVIVWFDVEMGRVFNLLTLIHCLKIKEYKLLIKQWSRDGAAAKELTPDFLEYDNKQDTHEQIIELAKFMSIPESVYISNQSDVTLKDPRSQFSDADLKDSDFHHLRDLNIEDEVTSSGIIFFTSKPDTCYVSNFYACKNSITTSLIQSEDVKMLERLNIVYASYNNDGKLVCQGNHIKTEVINSNITDNADNAALHVSHSLYVEVIKASVMKDDNNSNNNNDGVPVTGYVLQSLFRKLRKKYCLLTIGINELQLIPGIKIVLNNVENNRDPNNRVPKNNLLQIRLVSTEPKIDDHDEIKKIQPYLEHLITTCINEMVGLSCNVKMFFNYNEFLNQKEIPRDERFMNQPPKDPGRSCLTDLVLGQSFPKLYCFLTKSPKRLEDLIRFMGLELSDISKEGSSEKVLYLHIVKCNPHIRLLLRQMKCTDSEKEALLNELGIPKQYGRKALENVWEENKVEFSLCAVAVIIVVILVILVEALNLNAGKYGIAAVTSLSFILLVVKRCYYSYKREERKYKPLTFEEEP